MLLFLSKQKEINNNSNSNNNNNKMSPLLMIGDEVLGNISY